MTNGRTGFFIISPNREQPSVTECRFGVGRVQALFLVLCPFQKIHLSFEMGPASNLQGLNPPRIIQCLPSRRGFAAPHQSSSYQSTSLVSEDEEGKRSTVQLHTFETKLGLQWPEKTWNIDGVRHQARDKGRKSLSESVQGVPTLYCDNLNSAPLLNRKPYERFAQSTQIKVLFLCSVFVFLKISK